MAFDFGKFLKSEIDKKEKLAKKYMATVVPKALPMLQKEVESYAHSVIANYYANSPKRRYRPTGQLYKIANVKGEVDVIGDIVAFDIVLTIDPSKMGKHKSNSKYHQSGDKWIPTSNLTYAEKNNGSKPKQFGTPENSWIMGQFLEGIHPWASVDDEIPSVQFDKLVTNGSEILAKPLTKYVFNKLEKELIKYLNSV